MTPEECQKINDERLGRWKAMLVGQHATPLLLVGVCHDARLGDRVVIATLENLTDAHLLGFLRDAVQKIQAGQAEMA